MTQFLLAVYVQGKKTYLLKGTDCGAEKKTADFCASIAKEFIEEINQKYLLCVLTTKTK